MNWESARELPAWLINWVAQPQGRWALWALGAALVWLMAATGERILRRRQAVALFQALADSVASPLHVRGQLRAQGFQADFQPAPHPFRSLSVAAATRSRLMPSGWLAGRGRGHRLVFSATLIGPPAAEIIWVRNTPPLAALGSSPGRTLWTVRRLDFVPAEFATRGANPNAVCHEFQILQTRFAPGLLRLAVRGEQTPQLTLEVSLSAIDAEEIGPLMQALRALGRASLIA